jgi:transaldolase/glucose-6-phosphate isomerase
MNPLKALQQHGQSVWLDFMRRNLLGPQLDTLMGADGLMGITSNPAIFEKAIGHSADYDQQFAEIMQTGDGTPIAIYEQLAIADIQMAADRLRPIYDATKRRDGYVSLEVSPYLALDTAATIAEAKRLWGRVERPNLMVKVPGTAAGIPAIEALIAEGINVNVTLLFAQEVYVTVAEAYIRGLARYAQSHDDLSGIASVASFFVSRIDTLIDQRIDARLKETPGERATLDGLRGRVAIANARLAYQHYKALFATPAWRRLAGRGAQTQRLLWASTGTKNPAYRDVLYVETLIGADTVNTMPPATMDAFRDHGVARSSIEDDLDDAHAVMERLAHTGISMKAVTDQLVVEGVRLFADAADKLLEAVQGKRIKLLGDRLAVMAPALPDALAKAVDAEREAWRAEGRIRRLWAGDATLWSGTDEGKWLGWLDIVPRQLHELRALHAVAAEAAPYNHLMLLGMGGSSLGPEVLAETFGHLPNRPTLHVLDSTDPAQIRAFEAKIDLADTLFIVSSKSGGTLEPNILMQYFFERVRQTVGEAEAGRRFVAITDPGSKMEKSAQADGFVHVFQGDPAIGGRYSVLSAFGMVPAAAMGVDPGRFLAATQTMIRGCGPDVPPQGNPGVLLGTILGVAGKQGRDKVTILAGPGLEDFGAWAEQLIAESTGKAGHGLIPVDAEPVGAPSVYGRDRIFVHLAFADRAGPLAGQLQALEQAGHPVIRITLADRYQLGQEFFRWELATAVAGSILAINPFDQPDVEASKIATRKLTEAYEKSGRLPEESPILSEGGIQLFADPRNAEELGRTARDKTLAGYLAAHFARLTPGDYAAFLAYIPREKATIEALQALRLAIRDRRQVATCVGFGPRFQHSTGQAYKGGPNTGVFLQITTDDARDLPVPGRKYSFGIVKSAQARGDFDVLAERGRRVLRVHLGPDLGRDLDRLLAGLRQAIA